MQQTTKNRQASLVAAVMLTTSLPAAASEYLPLRFEENWGASCSKIAPKCWHIGKTATLTLGADARIRAQYYGPDNFGIDSGKDGYILFRGLAHGDLRVGKHVQAFVQFGVYDEAGRQGADPSAPIKAIPTCSKAS
ncbi:hypothetical protein [Nitrosomonas sp. Is37]|uniref:hypothetical protein n=1 Tax=Nitrosomonas sp. Is37 TaxID=3080535 RepID=UPI00294B6F82|nr:hypothetical protein [Nitrosomonas sp. Is37]